MGLYFVNRAKVFWGGICGSAIGKKVNSGYPKGKAWITSTEKYKWYVSLDNSLQLGLKATAIYLAAFIAIVGPYDIFHFLLTKDRDLHEIGDFLAGVLGPLSIFWVVLGYWQNQRALSEQATELKEAVRSARDHLELERSKLEPNFVVSNITLAYVLQGKRTPKGSGTFLIDPGAPVKQVRLEITMINTGASTSEVNVTLCSSATLNIEKFWSAKFPYKGSAKISTGEAVRLEHETVDFLESDGKPLDYRENSLFKELFNSPSMDLYLNVIWVGHAGKKKDSFLVKSAYVDRVPEGLSKMEHSGQYHDIRVIETLSKGEAWVPDNVTSTSSITFTPKKN